MNEKASNAASEYILKKKRFVATKTVSTIYPGDTSLYEYFTADGIAQGLTAQGQEFKLNDREIKILSGSLHYFRSDSFENRILLWFIIYSSLSGFIPNIGGPG